MNFQDLVKIENAQFYLESAFKHSKKIGEKTYPRTSGDRFSRIRKTEKEKVRAFAANIDERFDKITKNFPSLDRMPEFYQELIRSTLDYDMLKKSLGAVNWAKNSSKDISKEYERKVYSSRDETTVKRLMNEYYGRASSIIKQISKNLLYLENARQMMRSYPSLKTDLFTISITGFPNIGKSTLLSKITPAKPEIKDYAFTTKGLNQGYANYGIRKVQFVDTPGVLDRDKKNAIEEQAYLVLKYLTSAIIYVIDLTEPYPLKKQEALLKGLKEYDKPIIVYLSKADIIHKDIIAKAKKKYKAVSDIESLNKKIEKTIKEYYFE